MPIYKIFISSTSDLLETERRNLSDIILTKGDIPVNMELNLIGTNDRCPLEVDLEAIDNCDGMILIAGFIYGEIIGTKFPKDRECPLYAERNTCCLGCNGKGEYCKISYTEFEYHYAKSKDLPVFVLFKEGCDLEEKFKESAGSFAEAFHFKFSQGLTNNKAFIGMLRENFAKPYSSQDDFIKICGNICEELHKKLEKEPYRSRSPGLITAKQHNEEVSQLEDLVSKYHSLCRDGIAEVFADQNSVIKSFEKLHDWEIYDDENGHPCPIRVLAIRGESFVMAGHHWQPYIIGNEKKGERVIDVEFVLGSLENEDMIYARYDALKKQLPQKQPTLKDFAADYRKNMADVRKIILEISFCSLFEHSELRLPFRMIFMGKYLYLSTFLSNTPAAHAPVFKICKDSTLYKVCDEYYKWIPKKPVVPGLPQ